MTNNLVTVAGVDILELLEEDAEIVNGESNFTFIPIAGGGFDASELIKKGCETWLI